MAQRYWTVEVGFPMKIRSLVDAMAAAGPPDSLEVGELGHVLWKLALLTSVKRNIIDEGDWVEGFEGTFLIEGAGIREGEGFVLWEGKGSVRMLPETELRYRPVIAIWIIGLHTARVVPLGFAGPHKRAETLLRALELDGEYERRC